MLLFVYSKCIPKCIFFFFFLYWKIVYSIEGFCSNNFMIWLLRMIVYLIYFPKWGSILIFYFYIFVDKLFLTWLITSVLSYISFFLMLILFIFMCLCALSLDLVFIMDWNNLGFFQRLIVFLLVLTSKQVQWKWE